MLQTGHAADRGCTTIVPLFGITADSSGPVFYCSLGVDWRSYLDPVILQYLLAGVQFAIGDLPGEATPSAE